MEFFIKKNATLPLLKLQVVKDGRSDYNNFMKLIEVASLYFSMVDTETGIPKFTSRPAGIVEKTFDDPNAETEYYIYYQFSSNDTKDEGRYEGQFMIRSSEGVLILPIREKLFINIQDSFIADDLNYTNCYVSDFPCCVDFPTNPICPPCPSFEVTPTPTITPSLTPDLSIGLTLFSVVTSGSIVVTYNLVATMPVFTEISLDFSHVLGTTGDPIVITTGVTLNQGSTSTILVITLDEDYTTLTNNAYFSGVSINPPQYSSFFAASETTIFQITPTPTPTPTVTPTQPPEQIITDAIITSNVEYISVGVDLYLSYINPILPTPTPTITPSITPTITETPTQTPTITPSPSEPLYPLTLNVQLMSGGESIIFNGITYTENTTVNILLNTIYTIEGVPSPGYVLGGWGSTGGVSFDFLSGNTWTVSMDFTGGSSVTPNYEEIPLYPLTLYIQPLSGGQAIIFDGVTYTGETTVNIQLNTFYNIEAVPIPGYMFVGWNIFGGSFSSTGQSTTVAISLTSGANLAPSYAEDPNYDALEGQLTTSLVSYQNADDNNWVSITQEEYNNIFNNVDAVIKIGNTDEQVNTRETTTGYDTTTFGTVDANTPLTIPSGYYVVGFVAESWNQNGQVELGYTTTYHTGAPTYMGNSPNVIGGVTMFYVRKRPGNVEGAPASTNLYPVLNFLSPAYPNAVPNTYGWYTLDGGANWSETNPSFSTAKIQVLLTNVLSWPLPPLPSPSPTITPSPTPTITPSPTPAAVTATTYVYNFATGCTCDDRVMYSDSSSFGAGTYYSDINLTTLYPDGIIYYNGAQYTVGSGNIYIGGTLCPLLYCESECTSYTNYEISNNSYDLLEITFTLNNCSGFTITTPPLTLVYVNSNTVPITNCVRQIVVPTLWNGATSINSNTLQLTQTSETLQIQVNDIITDNIGSTSFVGLVSSDGTYTYVYTGPGGVIAFDCQFPLTFSGAC